MCGCLNESGTIQYYTHTKSQILAPGKECKQAGGGGFILYGRLVTGRYFILSCIFLFPFEGIMPPLPGRVTYVVKKT